MNSPSQDATVRAFSPGSVGNIGVGFDLLGHTIASLRDEVSVTRASHNDVRIIGVDGSIDGLSSIPLDAASNTAGLALLTLKRALELPFGFDVTIHKGIPLNAGLGGSASSAVAALVAANALLDTPLSREDLLPFAVEGESASCGSRQADNVAPMLMGGVVLAHGLDMVRFEVPSSWHAVVVHPLMSLPTKSSRSVLRDPYPLSEVVSYGSHLAQFVLGLERGDAALVRRGLVDVLVEPRRAPLIPGFAAVQSAAMSAGAMGCSISGAGPSVFAWFESESAARSASSAMVAAFEAVDLHSDCWVVPINGMSAEVVNT